MSAIDKLEKTELQELLIKGWMAHDGLWFYHSLQESGIEKTNRINLAAIRSMSAIEIKRIRKAFSLDKTPVTNFNILKDNLNALWGVVKGDFMDFQYTFMDDNRIHWDMGQCWAYHGIKSMGAVAIDGYQCGVMVRVMCWLDALQVKYTLNPEICGCLMHQKGSCSGDIYISF